MIEHWTVTMNRMREILRRNGAELHEDQGYVVAKWWGDDSRLPAAELIFDQHCELEESNINWPSTKLIPAFARVMARVDAALAAIASVLAAANTEGPGLSSESGDLHKAGHTEALTSPKSETNGDSTTESSLVTPRRDGDPLIPFGMTVASALLLDYVVEFHFGPDWYQIQHASGKRQAMHRWRQDQYRGAGWSSWRETSAITLRKWAALPARRVPVAVCDNDPLERGAYPEQT